MFKKLLLILVILILTGLIFTAIPTFAASIPDFPSCPNPGGTILAQYSSGTHGVPGDTSTHTGSDSVFSLSSTQVVQCFCPDSGSAGIQTNWLKADGFPQNSWQFVPDGSAWGLDAAPYLAQNLSFNCSAGGGAGSPGLSAASAPTCNSAKPATPVLLSVTRSNQNATLTWTAADQATTYTIAYGANPSNYIYGVPDTGNVTSFTIGALDPNATYYFAVRAVNNCMPGDFATLGTPSGIGGGEVLGLANTGNALTILALLISGLGLLVVYALYSHARHRTQ